MTGGDIAVKNGSVDQFPLLDRTFAKFGVEITHKDGWSRAKVDGTMRVRQPFTANILQKVEAAPLALCAGRPAADLRGARRAGRGPVHVLEQGL